MEQNQVRLFKFLACGPADAAELSDSGKMMLDRGEGKHMAVPHSAIHAMKQQGLLTDAGGRIALTAEGLAKARRLATTGEGGFQMQHREIELRAVNGENEPLAVNLNESPLGQIARRKDKQGRCFLNEAEVRAGERLRSDYTRGQIMPRLGANWEARVSSGRRGGVGGIMDLTDAALAARIRVDKAIAAVGPELSGVLLDVCCFLKGLETVEAERLWPARSAKILLKASLSALARHYEPPRTQARPRMFHWGSQDYRPAMD